MEAAQKECSRRSTLFARLQPTQARVSSKLSKVTSEERYWKAVPTQTSPAWSLELWNSA